VNRLLDVCGRLMAVTIGVVVMALGLSLADLAWAAPLRGHPVVSIDLGVSAAITVVAGLALLWELRVGNRPPGRG
jgi:hypothetical protein